MLFEDFQKRNRLGFTVDPGPFFIENQRSPVLDDQTFAMVRDGEGRTTTVRSGSTMSTGEGQVYRLVTFHPAMPQDLVGFMAFVSNRMSKASVPIFVLSSLSTDHILISEDNLAKARNALVEAGFTQI